MTPIEISEREVLAAAKAWHNADSYGTAVCLRKAVALLEEREHLAGNSSHDDVANSGNVIVSEPATFESLAPKPLIGDTAEDVYDEPYTVAEELGETDRFPPQGAPTLHRHPRKLSRRQQEIEKRRRSDPTGRDRDDIDYSSIEDPEVR